jgi:ureidoacrylate peracid hydrolase
VTVKTVMGLSCYSTLEEILDPTHTGLLVVDVQHDFVSPDGHFARHGKDIGQMRAMLPRLAALLDGAREHHVFVAYVQQTTLPILQSDSPAWLYFKTRDGKRPDYTLDGSWGQQIVPELRPRPDEPIVKKFRPSAFLGTSLEALLRNRGVETVVVSGVVTQGCVLATALEASFRDFYTVVAEECVQSPSQEQHENALRFLRSRYDLLPNADLLQLWSGRAAGQPVAASCAETTP